MVNNYDFLTNFALDYIINNKDKYSNSIIKLDNFNYLDSKYNNKKTNEYIDIEKVYDITNKYFGIDYYHFINNNINIIDNYISLSDYSDLLFNGTIKNITFLSNSDEFLKVMVEYDNNDVYKFTFNIKDNILYLYNIEV